jgi:hypothetical protein
MMHRGWTASGLVAVTALIAMGTLVSAASAVVEFPRKASYYRIWFVRAMDECTAANAVDVRGPFPNLPATGCLQANTETDDAVPMGFARLLITHTGKIAILGGGFPFGVRLGLALTLRVTRRVAEVRHPAGSNKRVTFEDVTIQCGNTPFGFRPSPAGRLAGVTTLSACLGSSLSDLAVGNIEVVNASLINLDTGKVFATAGVVPVRG